LADNFRKIWCNWTDKRLQRSNVDGTSIRIPEFRQYETIPFQVTFVEPSAADPLASYSLLDISNSTLTVSLNDTLDDATPLAEATGGDWSKDTSQNYFRGELVVNTSAMNTYVDAASKALYFQIELVDGTGRSRAYTELTTIKQSVTQVATSSPDPAKEYYTKDESTGLFRGTRFGNGEQLTLVSPDGTHERILGIDNDGNLINFLI